jgi:hypothetical protein
MMFFNMSNSYFHKISFHYFKDYLIVKLSFGWAIYPKWHAIMIVSNIGKQQANFVYQNINLKNEFLQHCWDFETRRYEQEHSSNGKFSFEAFF